MELLTTNNQEIDSPAPSETEILKKIDNIQDIESLVTLKPDRIHDDLRKKLFLYNSTKNDYPRPLSMENDPTPSSEELHKLALELAAITLKSDELNGLEATIKDETSFGYPPTTGTTDLVLEAYNLLDKDPQLAEYGIKMLSHLDETDRAPREAALMRSLEGDLSYSDELTKELARLDDELEKKEAIKIHELGKQALYNDLSNPDYHPYDQHDLYETRLVKKNEMVLMPQEMEAYAKHKDQQDVEASMAMSPADLFDDDDDF